MFIKSAGDILQTTAQAVVIPVNCVGVAGAGLALQFRNAFPSLYEVYQYLCSQGMKPGDTEPVLLPDQPIDSPRYTILFATKNHWRNKSQYPWIEAGLSNLAQDVQDLQIRSVAIPPLGCGLGGLSWKLVEPIIYRHLAHSDVLVELYPPRSGR